MSFSQTISVLYRKYPLLRISVFIVAIALIIALISLVTIETRQVPEITSISPAVGTAGDIMTISGTHFGEKQGTSDYVEVGGSRITSNGYLRWSDKQIRIILPTNVQDGLVIVRTKNGQSKPGFFANTADIPVLVPPDTQTSLPVISSISPSSGSYGTLITISGTNFGTIRGNAFVKFTANRDDADQTTMSSSSTEDKQGEFDLQYITANENNYDYEYWSDSEIRVRIPDGASSGPLSVNTEKGESNVGQIDIHLPAGTKSYTSRRTYLLQLSEEIENLDSKNPTTVTMRVPRPLVNASQPMAEMTECNPQPVIPDYKNTIIHQIELVRATGRKMRFSQNFVVSTYSVQTAINPSRVRPFSEKKRLLYLAATQPDNLILSRNPEIMAAAKEITGKESNPYKQVKLIFDYMLKQFEVYARSRRSNESILDTLKKKRGDAYDCTVLFTSLVRSLNIPCLPISGILVDSDLKAQPHWWTEFYIENFGWVPVDIALAKDALEYKAFKKPENPSEFYFGNLDGQHIAFSRGWNEVKPALINSKVVQRQKSYAFQSIWEESSAGKVNYSTLWNDPVVLGIY